MNAPKRSHKTSVNARNLAKDNQVLTLANARLRAAVDAATKESDYLLQIVTDALLAIGSKDTGAVKLAMVEVTRGLATIRALKGGAS